MTVHHNELTQAQIMERLGLKSSEKIQGVSEAEVETAIRSLNYLPPYISNDPLYSPLNLVKLANAASINA